MAENDPKERRPAPYSPTVATVTEAFDGVPDGEVHPVRLEVGVEIKGDLADAAIASKWAEPVGGKKPAANKAGGPSETK